MCSSQCWKAWRCREGCKEFTVLEFGVLNCFFVRKTSFTGLVALALRCALHSAPKGKPHPRRHAFATPVQLLSLAQPSTL